MAVATQTEQVKEVIDRLAGLGPAEGFPVLSLYLDARPGQDGRDRFGTFVRKELAARRALVDRADLASYDQDVSRIQEWLARELDPAANGVALFASDGRDLFVRLATADSSDSFARVQKALDDAFPGANTQLRRQETVGPRVGEELRSKALWAVLFSLGAILLHYITSPYVEAAVLVALVATVSGVLLKLGYVVTIWNSRSVVWIRQHIVAPPATSRRSD